MQINRLYSDMGLFVDYVITSSTIINATPEQIWDFFYHIENNYKKWHNDHDFWRWTQGEPLEVGSKIDSQETVGGHKGGIKASVIESVKNKKIALRPVWPLSFMCPKLEWIIEKKGEGTHFIAHTHYHFGKIYLTLRKKSVNEILFLTQKHMDEEGQNLKNILERK
jgi:hypothetical protein